jgi:hypothetical protein
MMVVERQMMKDPANVPKYKERVPFVIAMA